LPPRHPTHVEPSFLELIGIAYKVATDAIFSGKVEGSASWGTRDDRLGLPTRRRMMIVAAVAGSFKEYKM
jgi:hypothetical protein